MISTTVQDLEPDDRFRRARGAFELYVLGFAASLLGVGVALNILTINPTTLLDPQAGSKWIWAPLVALLIHTVVVFQMARQMDRASRPLALIAGLIGAPAAGMGLLAIPVLLASAVASGRTVREAVASERPVEPSLSSLQARSEPLILSPLEPIEKLGDDARVVICAHLTALRPRNGRQGSLTVRHGDVQPTPRFVAALEECVRQGVLEEVSRTETQATYRAKVDLDAFDGWLRTNPEKGKWRFVEPAAANAT